MSLWQRVKGATIGNDVAQMGTLATSGYLHLFTHFDMDVPIQLADWRTLAGRLLANLVPQIPGSGFTPQDELADDLLRSLANQPPRPSGRDPYVGVLGTGPVPT